MEVCFVSDPGGHDMHQQEIGYPEHRPRLFMSGGLHEKTVCLLPESADLCKKMFLRFFGCVPTLELGYSTSLARVPTSQRPAPSSQTGANLDVVSPLELGSQTEESPDTLPDRWLVFGWELGARRWEVGTRARLVAYPRTLAPSTMLAWIRTRRS